MGTSSSYGGPKSGIIPSWLSDGDEDGGVNDATDPENPANGQDAENSEDNVQTQIPASTVSMPTYQGAKSNYTSFAKSGKTAALGRAIKGYNASSGGGRGSAARMGSSTNTASGVASFSQAFSEGGAESALKQFNLAELSGRPAIEVLEALADQLCPDGGTIDEAIARDAMLEALDEFSKEDLGDFEEITPEQLGSFLAEVMTRSIVTKVINDIGLGSLHGTSTDTDFRDAQEQLRGYTAGAVRDALGSNFDPEKTMSQTEIESCMRDVYSDSFELLEAILEAAS